MQQTNERFDAIDGLKAITCLCIVTMHILANAQYEIGPIYSKIIQWVNFVFLFFVISAFGLCCGYFEKIRNRTESLENFYKRRYRKIFPFFVLLILIDLLHAPSLESLAEGFMESTLAFGFLPNMQLSVIGVSWFLGVIFVFYMLFPFFVFLLSDKRRAWFVFGVSITAEFCLQQYFFTDRFVQDSFVPKTNFLYCLPFFLLGGGVYLYRGEIRRFMNASKRRQLAAFVLLLAVTLAYFSTPAKVNGFNLTFYRDMIFLGLCFLCAVAFNPRFLGCKAMKFVSSISFEIYLVHMVIYRGIEKVLGVHPFGQGWISFVSVLCLDLIGCYIFIFAYRKIVEQIVKRVKK